MESLGDFLKEIRNKHEITLDEVSRDTRIDKKYLDALENEEFSVFPGEAYLKGFLRSYSIYLKLDPNEIIERYEKIKMAETPTPIEQLIPKPKKNLIPIIIIVAAVLTLPLLILGVIQFGKFIKVKQLEISKKREKEKNKVVYNIKEEDQVKIFNLKKEDKVDVEINSVKYTINVKKLSPDVVLNDNNGKDLYLFSNHLLKADLNNDQNYELGLYLNFWDDKQANITFTIYSEYTDSQNKLSLIGENPETIINSSNKDKIEFLLDVQYGSFIRYKIDDKDEIEGYFNSNNDQKIQAENNVIVWLSNAGAAKLNFTRYNKIYNPGNIGEISVKLIKWNKNSNGQYELQVSSLK